MGNGRLTVCGRWGGRAPRRADRAAHGHGPTVEGQCPLWLEPAALRQPGISIEMLKRAGIDPPTFLVGDFDAVGADFYRPSQALDREG